MTSSEIDILIFNAHILTINEKMETVNRGFILINNSEILDIGSMEKFHSNYGNKIDAKEEIDARGDIVLPGFVNTHGHFAMTLFRGIADDIPLMKWLREYIWPVESKLTKEDCYIGAQLAAIEMIQGGTTAACDMYFNELRTLDAMEEIGFRGVLGHGMLDLGDKEKLDVELITTKELIAYAKEKATVNSIIISPHAPNTCSDELLFKAKELAEKEHLPIQIHLAETRDEVKEIQQQKGDYSPTEYLDKIDFLSENLIAAHCIWLSERDCQLLQKNQVNVAHNPSSNFKLGSGIFNYNLLSKLQINICLGTDGAASNNNLSMIEEMRLASLFHKGVNLNAKLVPSQESLRMATINGAKALGLSAKIGSLEIGKKADLIIINTKMPNVWPPHDPFSLIVYSAQDSNVKTTIINGETIMKDRRLLTINATTVMAKAKEAIGRLLDQPDLKQYKTKLKFLH